MLTINSGISYFAGNQVQPSLNNPSETSSKNTRSASQENNSEDTVKISQEARELEQTYQEKENRLDQRYESESQQLQREYLQEKNRLEQEFNQRKQSLQISVYA